jgi:hypothetical protein
VLYLLRRYPQISESYIETELRAVSASDDISVIALGHADLPSTEHHDFEIISLDDDAALAAAIADFEPHVVHGHYVHHAPALLRVATLADCAYTVRAHSYDILDRTCEELRVLSAAVNDDRCLGILTFPFTIDRLLEAGVSEDRIVPCYPVVDYHRFLNLGPNGRAVMNVGAALPKKDHKSYVDLAARLPDRDFNLYAMGYESAEVARYNASLGTPVHMVPVKPYAEMPQEYKRHEWLVYTASVERRTVGWPMAIAEAQAAGVGVCVQDIRSDLREYVGPAGHVFSSIEEALEIVSAPVSEEARRRGAAHAMRSDVNRHIGLLRELWRAA